MLAHVWSEPDFCLKNDQFLISTLGESGYCTGVPQWIGDGYCDDENNNHYCAYDAGDCCGPNVITAYCVLCQCLSNCSTILIGDGYCLDINNRPDCNYDGGDCCGTNNNYDFCTECLCLDGSANQTTISTVATSAGTVTTKNEYFLVSSQILEK